MRGPRLGPTVSRIASLQHPTDGTTTVEHREEASRVRDMLLTLEDPARADMDDPSLEWRRLFSEMLGTFLLVMAGAGGAVVNAVSGGQISRAAAVTAPGLT